MAEDQEFAPGQEARPPFAVAGVAENLQAGRLPSPGEWVYTSEWQGPFLEVVKATDQRVTCKDFVRRYFLDPAKIIAIGPNKEAVQEAHRADLASRRLRDGELSAARDASRAAKGAQYALEREITAEARAAARAAIAKAEGRDQ